MKRLLSTVMSIGLIIGMIATGVMSAGAKTIIPPVDTAAETSSVYGGTPDTTWYDEEKTEFTLTTASQFMGIAPLVNLGVTTFAGKTIKLGTNMIINTGNASEWTAQTTGLYTWNPIGHCKNRTVSFAGTFDGQGHYISGVFSPSTWSNTAAPNPVHSTGRDNGLFFTCLGATLKNFALVNSCFINTGANSAASQNVGSVAGRFYNGSVMQNVYSNAFVTGGFGSGGLVGYIGNLNGNPTMNGCLIENCIYEGTLNFSIAANNACVGGLVDIDDLAFSTNKTVTIRNCIFAGTMFSRNNADDTQKIAGIMGSNRHTVISSCINAGTNDMGNRTTTSYSNIACYYNVYGGKVENCYIDSDKKIANANSFVSNKSNGDLTGCVELATGSFTAANTSNLLSGWTYLANDYPVPTTAWNIYKQYRQTAIRNISVQNTEIADNKYAVRMIAQINSLDYAGVGYEVTLTTGGQTYTAKDYTLEYVYKTIHSESITGDASAALGSYFVAATIKDIPVSVGEVKFAVRAYVFDGSGNRTYADTCTITYNAGEFVSAVNS